MFLTVILRHPDIQIKTQEEPKSVVRQIILESSPHSGLCGVVPWRRYGHQTSCSETTQDSTAGTWYSGSVTS